jgi:hypothetical protein
MTIFPLHFDEMNGSPIQVIPESRQILKSCMCDHACKHLLFDVKIPRIFSGQMFAEARILESTWAFKILSLSLRNINHVSDVTARFACICLTHRSHTVLFRRSNSARSGEVQIRICMFSAARDHNIMIRFALLFLIAQPPKKPLFLLTETAALPRDCASRLSERLCPRRNHCLGVLKLVEYPIWLALVLF